MITFLPPSPESLAMQLSKIRYNRMDSITKSMTCFHNGPWFDP